MLIIRLVTILGVREFNLSLLNAGKRQRTGVCRLQSTANLACHPFCRVLLEYIYSNSLTYCPRLLGTTVAEWSSCERLYDPQNLTCLLLSSLWIRDFPGDSDGKESACSAGDRIWSLHRDDPLEKGVATHSSILAWRIPWTEEPGGLQSLRLQRVLHNWATNTHSFIPLSKKCVDPSLWEHVCLRVLPWGSGGTGVFIHPSSQPSPQGCINSPVLLIATCTDRVGPGHHQWVLLQAKICRDWPLAAGHVWTLTVRSKWTVHPQGLHHQYSQRWPPAPLGPEVRFGNSWTFKT